MKPNGYRDRAMRARDPRFAAIFDRLRYGRRDMVATAEVAQPATAPELPLTAVPAAKPKKPADKPQGES